MKAARDTIAMVQPAASTKVSPSAPLSRDPVQFALTQEDVPADARSRLESLLVVAVTEGALLSSAATSAAESLATSLCNR